MPVEEDDDDSPYGGEIRVVERAARRHKRRSRHLRRKAVEDSFATYQELARLYETVDTLKRTDDRYLRPHARRLLQIYKERIEYLEAEHAAAVKTIIEISQTTTRLEEEAERLRVLRDARRHQSRLRRCMSFPPPSPRAARRWQSLDVIPVPASEDAANDDEKDEPVDFDV